VPPTATPVSGSVRVLCDGKVYDGYTTRLFQLDSATDRDPTILKVIRNCVFRNSSQVPTVLKDAKNVLIEGNTFANIRTHVAGDGVHAINIPGPSAGSVTSGITIRNNRFQDIGADGIQLGQNTRYIRNVTIQNNEFVGSADVGENAVDVKGVEGPVIITGNKVHGFRPCESPKSNPSGTQDCSGSNGPGLTIHEGGLTKTSAYNVTVENNDVYDNTIGLVVSTGTRNIVVRGNRISNNLTVGLDVHDAYSVSVTNNTFSYNPTHIRIANTPNASGGSCTVSGNTFVGGNTNISGACR
jgi:parallel beta-helix repeat protein